MSTERVDMAARGWSKAYRVDVCRCGCGVKPEGKRRTFASDACVDRHRMRTDPGYVRWRVFERDRGVCSECHRDTTIGRVAARYLTLVLPLGKRPGRATLGDWQADHIVPVVEGGGLCGLENYRTLCTRCHKLQTAALRKRLSHTRKKIA